jgi:hypothetical protein
MAVFAIIPQPNPGNPKMGQAVSELFKDANIALDGGSGWLVSGETTAQEIAKKLHILDDSANGAAVIVEVASYFGRANPNIWSWMKTAMEKTKNA